MHESTHTYINTHLDYYECPVYPSVRAPAAQIIMSHVINELGISKNGYIIQAHVCNQSLVRIS